MPKHTILFLAANPHRTDSGALEQEARSIQEALKLSGNRFEFVTWWATQPLDLLRGLRALRPAVVHFSGDGDSQGLSFQGENGKAKVVAKEALAAAFGAVTTPVKLVVLNACYSEVHAEALLAHVGCVVGMAGSFGRKAARSFAIGFYGGLGDLESVSVAYRQGRAAISLEGLPGSECPQLCARRRTSRRK